jgi:hypothetical protein
MLSSKNYRYVNRIIKFAQEIRFQCKCEHYRHINCHIFIGDMDLFEEI